MNGVEMFFTAYGSITTTAVIWAVIQTRKLKAISIRQRGWSNTADDMNVAGTVVLTAVLTPVAIPFLTVDAVKLYRAQRDAEERQERRERRRGREW